MYKKVNKMVYMKRTLKLKSKSKKSGGEYTHSHIVCVFLEMLNMVKLYHWKTYSFSTHKATDEL